MHVLVRGSRWQLARLASGLILLAFAVTHFINHALGLVSLDAMAAMQHWRIAISRSLAGRSSWRRRSSCISSSA
jgi:adenylate cyclase